MIFSLSSERDKLKILLRLIRQSQIQYFRDFNSIIDLQIFVYSSVRESLIIT